MAQTIYIKNSAVTGVEPTSLGKGEIAINISDGNLFYGDAGGNVSQNFSFIHSGATSIGALTATSGTFRSNVNISGTTTLVNSILTTTDINGGTIDGCNINLGSEKILDGSEGTIDLRNAISFKTSSEQNLAILQGAGTNVNIGAYMMRASTLRSDVATGTAPLTVASTTVVANLHVASATSVMTNANLTGDITSVGNETTIASDVIINSDVKSDAAIDYSKLAALSDGNILVGNGSNVATSVNPSGDVDVTNAGVFSIASDVIINADVKSDAAIAQTKIDTNVDLGGDTVFGTQTDDTIKFEGIITAATVNGTYQYITFSFKANGVPSNEWMSPSGNGPEYYLWGNKHGGTSAQAASAAPSGATIGMTISVDYLDFPSGFVIPRDCKLIGFYGNCRVNTTSPNTLRPVMGLFRGAEPVDGYASDLTCTCIALDKYDTAGGNRKNRFLKLETTVDTDLAQGDLIVPAVGFDASSTTNSGAIWGSFTIILKT